MTDKPITFGAQMSEPQTDVDMVQTLQATNPMAVAYGVAEQPDISHCLRSGASKADKHESTTYVAQPVAIQDVRAVEKAQNGRGWNDDGTAYTVDTHATQGVAIHAMQVRRLTPVECERLQGFPDGWTAIPWRGKPADQCPDGPRYKALGNSMAVPVIFWIGQQLDKVK